jgi:bifunctional enzyme CysN/CysC
MATGASTADLAVILVDATKGLLPQTLRHSAIVALMGIRRIVLAVNKMDLVGYREDCFAAIVEGYSAMAGQLGLRDVTAIPVCALRGDNVIRPSAAMPWYRGPTLLDHLEMSRLRRSRISRSGSPCSGSTVPTVSAAMPAPCWAAACVRATRSSSCRRACGRA